MRLLIITLFLGLVGGCASHPSKNPFATDSPLVIQEIILNKTEGYFKTSDLDRTACRNVDFKREEMSMSEFRVALCIIEMSGDAHIFDSGRVYMSPASIKISTYFGSTTHCFLLMYSKDIPKIRKFLDCFDGELIGKPMIWDSLKKEPNKALQTTIMAVTDSATQTPRQP